MNKRDKKIIFAILFIIFGIVFVSSISVYLETLGVFLLITGGAYFGSAIS